MKLKRFKEGIWVPYPKATEVEFKIRPQAFSATMDILAQVKEKRVVDGWPDPRDPSKKGPTVVDDWKDGAFLWGVFDRALEEWRGIDPTPEGEELSLPPSEIKRLIFDNDEMREFIFQKSRELLEKESSKLDEERKN